MSGSRMGRGIHNNLPGKHYNLGSLTLSRTRTLNTSLLRPPSPFTQTRRRYKISVRKAHLSRDSAVNRCLDKAPHIHTNRTITASWSWRQTTSEKGYSDVRKRTAPAFTADWNIHLVFKENGKNIGSYHYFLKNCGLISVTVMKWHITMLTNYYV